MSNRISTTKDRRDELMRGIFLGRTLHDLEKQAGAPLEDILLELKHDEEAFLDFKAAREWGAFIQDSEITTKLRENAENPESAIKTNALKLYADHLRWSMERANPTHFSNKIDLSAVIPVKINTVLDLGGHQQLENVYDLTATIPIERKEDEISDSEFNLLETSARTPPSGSPFNETIAAMLDGKTAEEATDAIEEALTHVSRSEGLSARTTQTPDFEEALEEALARKKPRRQRQVVRKKQRVVEQTKKRARS